MKKNNKRLFKASVKIASSIMKGKLYKKLVKHAKNHNDLVQAVAGTAVDYAKAIEDKVYEGDDN
jgi:hypothetical protein